MKLSVIIVNYNVRYFLEQCLISVHRAAKNISTEVFVVDNASSDGSCQMVKEKFPWVKLIESETNLGFSKANNHAIQVAMGEYVLLLNPDTFIAEDTFEKCLAFMDKRPDAGALGVRMIDGRGNFLPESKRGLPTPSVAFYKTFGLASIFPHSKTFGKYHLGYLPEQETSEVDILSGAFMFMRKAALDKTGLLDETFFMYGEDIDLSYRIIKAGFKNYYFADTTIVHYKGESTKKGSLNYVRVFYNAMIIFSKKHFSGNQSSLFSLFINIAIIFRGLLTLLAGLFSSSYLFIVDALFSFVGIYLVKVYWEDMIKYTDHYYPRQFLFIVVPTYILIWILSTFLSGGYDKPFRISNIIRGVFWGTIAIAVVYAFLPNEWRFSRAIILLGAAWTAFEMMATRISYNLIRHQSLAIENEDEKRTVLVGSGNETSRADKLLAMSGSGNEIEDSLNSTTNLKSLSELYGINEIVFCAADITYKQIIDAIMQCGNSFSYKILNEDCEAFIGSNSKDTAGDVYSSGGSFKLGMPLNKRRKRLFDFAASVVLILLFPVNLFLVKNFGHFTSNLFSVLFGTKTWVGYVENNSKTIPPLKPSVITIGDTSLDSATVEKLNRLYARHYSVAWDAKLLWQNYRNLGK